MNKKESEQKRIFWQRHMLAVQRSGITVSEYCRREGLSRDVFQYWKKALRAARSDQEIVSTSFLPVEIIDDHQDVKRYKARCALPDARWLAEFVVALGEVSR